MSQNKYKPITRKTNIVVQEFQFETLIYDLELNKALCLNQTSTMIWQACDGIKDISAITVQIRRQTGLFLNEDFVWLALERLKNENLLENTIEFSNPFENLSRREVMRKIGFSTLVLLPIISLLIAPTAADALSVACPTVSKPLGCPCTTQTSCSSGCCSSTPRTCVVPGSKGSSTPCIANCECSSGICSGSPQRCF